MNERQDRHAREASGAVERLMARFRLARPDQALRQRVLDADLAGRLAAPRWRIALWVWRSAVAAGLVVAVWLNLAGERMAAQVASQVGVGPPVWTRQAEEAAELLDGQGTGRQYLAMVLRAGALWPGPTPVWEAPPDAGLIPSR